MQESTHSDPRYHTNKIQTELDSLINHLRKDIEYVDDPKAEALFETSAEVLVGLRTAFEHFTEKSEQVWK
jgi:hypothetical protein